MLNRLNYIYRRMSVRSRLILTIFAASVSVLVAIGVALAYFGTRVIEQQAEVNVKTTIGVLSQDFVKILLLDAPDVAADAVAKLEAFPDVLATFLYDSDGEFRFGYYQPGAEETPVPAYQATDLRYQDNYLEVFAPLSYRDREYGVIYVRMSTENVRQSVTGFYKLIMIVVPVVMLFALVVAIRFQRSFSEPIHQLASAFQQVGDQHQYDMHLDTWEKNEIGDLFNGFNRMLVQIRASSLSLEESGERLRVTLESISDGVIASNEQGCIVYLNDSAEKMLQWQRQQAQGKPVHEVARIFTGESKHEVRPCQQALLEGRRVPSEPNMQLVNLSEERIAVSVSAAPMWGPAGSVIGAVMVVRDVTESQRLTRELSFQASHDSLTGLINRTEFERLLEHELESAKARNETFILMYLDLDQFKVVNDTCGHLAGDQFLRQLTSILKAELRASDVLARLGGDEFGILLSGCDVNTGRSIAEALIRIVGDFRFAWEAQTFAVGLSIGMVVGDRHSESMQEMLRAADIACYSAKDAGRNRVHQFSEDDAVTQRRSSELQWVSRIISGLDEDRFCLYRQRIAPVAGGESGDHFEILIRMLDEEGRLVPPGSFFPAAERFGITPNIDRWVLRNVLKYFEDNPDELKRLSMCCVNLSGHTLADEHFLDFVESCLDNSQVPAENLCFEVTETAAIANLAIAKEFIARLKVRGCRFALDDFGSGLSSFAYLKNLDVNFLKIDGMFVRDMAEDPIDRSMVKSINEIGHVMGMKTIAEFVEDERILKELEVLGVDYAQGYGIHKPEPLPSTGKSRLKKND